MAKLGAGYSFFTLLSKEFGEINMEGIRHYSFKSFPNSIPRVQEHFYDTNK